MDSLEWISPIYDRTQADVDEIKKNPLSTNTKGVYNYTDLNRIENNCSVLKELLFEKFGINTKIITKVNWSMEDIPTIEDLDRIRNNIIKLINNMNLGSECKYIEFSNTMNYIKANILEKDMYLLKKIVDTYNKKARYCNTFICGSINL